ncbi:MAG: hypothetical protein WCJ35_12380 [Planctomycetota bacterium]
MLSPSSVLSSTPGFLVLRVRGSTRDGQVVRLESTKCTIGSGSHCTLRLRAVNIGAVHCLILRGPGRTVVRRWSPDTRLNGRNFTESALQAGDCLSIGAIDLEVVETAQPGLPSENLREQQCTIDQQLAQIQARLCSLDEQQAECDATQADFQARQSELDMLRAQWELQKTESQADLASRAAELDALQVELDSACAALNNERGEWESRRGKALTSQSTEAEQLAAQQVELDAQRRALEEQRVAWETQKSEIAEQAAAHEADRQRLRVEFESAQEVLASERLQWESQQGEVLAARSTESTQVAAQQANLDAQYRALEEQRVAWETQKSEIAEQAAAHEADRQRLRVEFESAQEVLASERLQWESQQGEVLAARSTESTQLAAQQANLDAQYRALEEQQAAWETQKIVAHQTLDDRVAGLDALCVDLESQHVALEKERRQWESQLRNATAIQSTETEHLAVREVLSETERKPVAEAETVKITAPTTATPVDLLAILRRTGFNTDQADEEEQSNNNFNHEDESSKSGPAEEPLIDISAPVPRPLESVGQDREEEVSIDEYMSRLLARSRGDSAPSSDPAAVSAVAAPQSSSISVVPEPHPEPPDPCEPVEMAPRAVVAERQVDLQAMRQLANLSAKNALHKHESKRLSGNTRAKLLVTSVSVVAGVSLLVIYLLPGAPHITIYGAVASLAVAVLWGVRYKSLASRMTSERLAYMSRHIKAVEEPAAEVKKENRSS